MIKLCIDPSINHCGFAVFDDKKLIAYGLLQPETHYTAEEQWIFKATSILHKIEQAFTFYICDKIILEFPTIWYNPRGAMAKSSGAIQKLYFMCGLIIGRYDKIVYIVTPQEWKGQGKKAITINRVNNIFNLNLSASDSDIADAIGVGEWYNRNVASVDFQ